VIRSSLNGQDTLSARSHSGSVVSTPPKVYARVQWSCSIMSMRAQEQGTDDEVIRIPPLSFNCYKIKWKLQHIQSTCQVGRRKLEWLGTDRLAFVYVEWGCHHLLWTILNPSIELMVEFWGDISPPILSGKDGPGSLHEFRQMRDGTRNRLSGTPYLFLFTRRRYSFSRSSVLCVSAEANTLLPSPFCRPCRKKLPS
jgi:hypothetical protein